MSGKPLPRIARQARRSIEHNCKLVDTSGGTPPCGVLQVLAYITSQAGHHREKSFEEEYVAFLAEHGMECDPKHLWDEEHV
jgi:hypothetical protein